MDATTVGRLVRDHLTLIVTGALFFAMAVRLLTVSRGDPAVLALLVQHADLVQVLLSVLVDLAMLATPLAAGSFALALITTRHPAVWAGAVASTVIAAHVAPVILLMPVAALYGTGAVVLLWAMHRIKSGDHKARERLFRLSGYEPPHVDVDYLEQEVSNARELIDSGDEHGAARVVDELEQHVAGAMGDHEHRERRHWLRIYTIWGASLLFMLTFFLLWSSPWMPHEMVELDDGTRIGAHVVTDQGPWVHLLALDDRSVVTARSEHLVSRELCTPEPSWNVRGRWPARSLMDILRGADPPTVAPCPNSDT